MSSDPIEVLLDKAAALEKVLPVAREYAHAPEVREFREALAAALASLSAPKRHERPKGNSPIEELLAEYEEEGCDHSNMQWVRAAARRYVETMEDSQIRCLLHVLSAHKAGNNMEAGAGHVQVSEWAVVPREPTEAMVVAWNGTGPDFEDAYAAMLAAAPKPDAWSRIHATPEYAAALVEVDAQIAAGKPEMAEAVVPDRIVLWSRGVEPNWYFVAQKSDRQPIDDMAVYETLDEIVRRGSSGAWRPAAVDEAMVGRFCRRWYEITGRSLERVHVLASLDSALAGQQGGPQE